METSLLLFYMFYVSEVSKHFYFGKKIFFFIIPFGVNKESRGKPRTWCSLGENEIKVQMIKNIPSLNVPFLEKLFCFNFLF